MAESKSENSLNTVLDADDSSCTEIRQDCTVTYCWTVKNFSKYPHEVGQHIDSLPFSAQGDPRKFCLRLYPKGREPAKYNYLSLYLVLISGAQVSVTYSISFVNGKGEKGELLSYSSPQKLIVRDARNSHIGQDQGDWILVKSSYLSKDIFKIFCELTIVTFPHHTSGVRKHLSNIPNDIGQLLMTNREYSDVILQVDGLDLHAHKAVLAARSPVFSAMFRNEMEERERSTVVITDINYNTVMKMLRFIYSGTLHDLVIMARCRPERGPTREEMAMATELLHAADKYELEGLMNLCEDAISCNLSVDMAAEVLVLSDLHNAHDLKLKTIEFIRSNNKEVKKTSGWKRALVGHSKMILEALF